MLLPWTTTLFLASAVSAANKGCNSPSFTTITTVSPTPISTSTRSTTITTTLPISSTSSTTSDHPTSITSLADSCTYRPTQTFYSSSGCALTCATGFCVYDAPATVSCGCPRVIIETQTVTVCATKTPCQQCYTGWGTFLYTEPCATSTASAKVTSV